jgi:general secretion pathway protein F
VTVYRYRALTRAGELVVGEITEASQAAAVEKLQRLGQMPFHIRPATSGGWPSWLNRDLFGSRRLTSRGLGIMTHELATLLQAGLPLDRGLEILSGLAESRQGRAALVALLSRIRGGACLADAMGIDPVNFPKAYVSMVRAGELGGTLEATLFHLAEFLARSHATSETIRSAMIYPIILLVLSGISIAIILTVVLPQLEPLFHEAGNALPLSTQILMTIAKAIQDFWWLLLLLLIGSLVLLRHAADNPVLRLRWHGVLLKLPLIRGLIAKSEAARFSRTLGTLLRNGVPMSLALPVIRGTLGNVVMAKAIDGVAARLKEGEGLAAPLAKAKIFPELSTQLVRVGEETGRLDEMLLKLADIYDRDVQRVIDRLLALLVPLLTVALGCLIAAIVASVLAALLSVNELAG